MPNRIIKESICTSENLNNLTTDEEVFFYRLMVKVDDYGRYDARPAVLRAACYPLRIDKVKEKDIDRWMKSLIREKLVVVYLYKGQPYLYLTTWLNHQTPRAKNSKYPDPANTECIIQTDENICTQMHADSPVFDIRYSDSVFDIRDSGKHGKHVSLSQDEYKSLVESLGEQATKDYIERLNDYIEQIGPKKAAKYKSHYATIKNWYRRDQEKKPQNKSPVSKIDKAMELAQRMREEEEG